MVVITSFYGQPQFQSRFGTPIGGGAYAISASWQSGLSNSSAVGQLAGLIVSGYLADKIGPRKTTMAFLVWMAASIFATFFAPSLSVLAFGLAMCGVGWVSQSLGKAADQAGQLPNYDYDVCLRGGPNCSSTIRCEFRAFSQLSP